MSDAAEAAVELSEQLGGAWVFPIEPSTKGGHFGRSWAEAASNKPNVIRKRFAKAEKWIGAPDYKGYKGEPNIGIACKPSGLVVVDIDDKGDKSGSKTWANLTEGVEIWTRTHTTPTGGRHVFFHSTEDLPNAVEWAPGLDLRASGGKHGGYVLVGSVDGAELQGEKFKPGVSYSYDVAADVPVAAMPNMLLALLRASDEPGDFSAVTHYSELVEQFVTMSEGDGRNNAFASICGYLRNWIPHDDAFRMTAYLLAANAEHPMPDKEISATILSLEKATRKEITDAIGGVESGPTWATVTAADMFDLFTGNVVDIMPDVLQRSDGTHAMYTGETHIFFGESGIGKSWVLFEACRQELMKGNGVVFIDQESSRNVTAMRLRALGLLPYTDTLGEVHPGAITPEELSEMFAYLRAESGLGVNPDGTMKHEQLLDELGQTIDRVRPTLVVIDGLTNAFMNEGLSTNSAEEVAAFYGAVTEPLAREFNAAIASIDHVTKNKEMRTEALGSIHKTAGVTGASYGILATPGEPRVGKNQDADIWITGRKDRLGGAQDSLPMNFGSPIWGVGKMRPLHGKFEMTIDPWVEDPVDLLRKQNPWAAAAERISDILVEAREPMSKAEMLRFVRGEKRWKDDAMIELEERGFIEIEGSRPQMVRLVRPYRIALDPKYSGD